MKSLIFLFFILGLANAQEPSKTTVYGVSVGDAQLEKDQIAIGSIETEGSFSAAHTNFLKETKELLRNDFAFYKHKFDAIDTGEPQSRPNWEGLSGKQYAVGFKARPEGAGIRVYAQVWSVLKKQSLGNFDVIIQGTSARDEGHRLADQVYRSITGKPSVFLSKIVFVSDRSTFGKDTKKELYIMDFDGRRVERLTFFNSTVISPAISPDGRYVIFSLIQSHVQKDRKNKETKNIDLKVYDLKTKKFETVSGHPGVNSGAVYSADGKNIYFTLTKGGNADIYEMNLATKQLRQITTNHAEDVDPTVNSEGTSMSFLSNRAGRANIYTMDPRGKEKDVTRISYVGQFNASPRYSPDGQAIVFTSWVDNNFDLYRIDSKGGNLARLTKDFGSNEEPWWSPDGEFIIFTSQRVLSRTKATQDIFLMNKEGEVLGQLTQGFGRCFSPRWSNL